MLETEHFRVSFVAGLDSLARHAAVRAEVAHARLSVELAPAPPGKIDIVLADNLDYVAGAATISPSRRILLNARAPADHPALSYQIDWLDMLVVHELTHIFHLSRTSLFGRAFRLLFGHAPLGWPLHPVVQTPRWSVEGLAVALESRHTGAGRVHGSQYEMVLRTAVLGEAFPPIFRAEGYDPRWPGAHRPYIYGSLFFDYIARTHGEEAFRQIVDATASAVVPPVVAFDRVARRAIGSSFSELWDDWHEELETRYGILADSLAEQGLTQAERLTPEGRYAMHPRIGPDGGRIAFLRDDGRSDPVTVLLDPARASQRVLARRSQFGGAYGPASWLPDGSGLIKAQFEYDGPYRVVSDLYRVGVFGDEWRLTRRARLSAPDVARDGRRVAAIQDGEGTNRVVVFDLVTRQIEPLTSFQPGVHWTLPRWAPDGRRMAVGRWSRGQHDIVVMDEEGAEIRRFQSGHATAEAPAWSPDGRYLLFSSDRNGIPNLFALDFRPHGTGEAAVEPVLYQVTNVLTGAFHPDVSSGSEWIVYSGYDTDGYSVQRIPFDTASWRVARDGLRPRTLAAAPSPEATVNPETVEVSQVRLYDPGSTLGPRFWLPVYHAGDGVVGRFFGARTWGRDLVGQHSYSAWMALGESRRYQGHLGYTYAGMGNPVLQVDLRRSWEGCELFSPDPTLLREDIATLSTTYTWRGWRRSMSASVGAERLGRLRRHYDPDAEGQRPITKPVTTLFGVTSGFGLSTARRHPFSISTEEGFRASVVFSHYVDFSPPDYHGTLRRQDGYTELAALARAYVPLGGVAPGADFARPVVAARLAGGWRYGGGARLFPVGGASGALEVVEDIRTGGTSPFFPVRGFERPALVGTRAWAASVEYRMPLALLARSRGVWPLFLDRLSGAVFLDGASAWCSGSERGLRYAGCPSLEPLGLLGAGAELNLDLRVARMPFHFRAGTGYPIHGPGDQPRFHLATGAAF